MIDRTVKVRFLEPIAARPRSGDENANERPLLASSWRDHLAEIAFVAAVWVLALLQVGMAVSRGGGFTADSSLALAFALGCPLALRGFGR